MNITSITKWRLLIAIGSMSLVLVVAALLLTSDNWISRLWLAKVFLKGGVIMWPILLCSVLALAITFERLYYLRHSKVINKDFLADVRDLSSQGKFDLALKLCDTSTDVAMSKVIQAGLLRSRYGVLEIERAIEAAGSHEATLLQANLRGLGVLANITPMLGLLGTVMGMIKAFNVISESGTGNPGLVATGISEALITTAAGLIVGIPVLAIYHSIRSKVDRLIYDMEEESLRFVEDIQHYVKEKPKQKPGKKRKAEGGDEIQKD